MSMGLNGSNQYLKIAQAIASLGINNAMSMGGWFKPTNDDAGLWCSTYAADETSLIFGMQSWSASPATFRSWLAGSRTGAWGSRSGGWQFHCMYKTDTTGGGGNNKFAYANTGLTVAGDFVVDDPGYGSASSVAATALITGKAYKIIAAGTSDFTLVGAANNAAGTVFTATGTTTGTGTASEALDDLQIGRVGANGQYMSGSVCCFRVFDSTLTLAEWVAEARSATPVKSGCVANWRLANNGDLTDTVSGYVLTAYNSPTTGADEPTDIAAADALAVIKILGRWRRMPTRMVSGAWRYVRQLADAAANLAANVFNVTMSETGSATDSLSAQLSAAVSLAEAANAADTISNVLTSARSFTEAGGATDTLTTTATFPRSIGTEAGSAGDSLSSSVGGFDVTIAETATAVDSISALLNAAVVLAETGSATDSYSNIATLLAALAESVTATDSYSSALNGGNYSVSFTEAATAVDSIAAQVAWSRDVAETGNATDTTSAQAAFQRAVAEAVAALDAVSAGGITNVTIAEAGAASDSVSAPTGFGEVPPERVITIQLADRVVRITKTRRPIRVLN
jgi:hypothetical protein